VWEKFVPEMSTHSDLLLQRLNWCYQGETEQISLLQNVDGKLGKKFNPKSPISAVEFMRN